MTTQLSVIIPALNEAATLPGLLDALRAQTRPPDEIIVADAGSRDDTRELARQHGAVVVRGGRPGPGRNAGARFATGDVLLFLDSDVLPRPDFVGNALDEFARSGAAVATCLSDTLTDNLSDRIITEAVNLYLQVVQPISPHAPGYCILARKDIHEAIGGFDESVKLAEDHDYVQRAAERGEFVVLSNVRIPVSMRRLEKEGLTRLALKYLWCEMHALAGKPIYSTPFEYEFGEHVPAAAAPASASARRVIDIGQLREHLGRFENPVQRLSEASLAGIDRLTHLEWVTGARERLWLALDRAELETLHRYLHRRLALIRKTRRPLRETLIRLQSLPIKESIRVLDLNWLRLHLPGSATPEDRS